MGKFIDYVIEGIPIVFVVSCLILIVSALITFVGLKLLAIGLVFVIFVMTMTSIVGYCFVHISNYLISNEVQNKVKEKPSESIYIINQKYTVYYIAKHNNISRYYIITGRFYSSTDKTLLIEQERNEMITIPYNSVVYTYKHALNIKLDISVDKIVKNVKSKMNIVEAKRDD